MNLTPYPAPGADSVRPGYEQFLPPAAPAGTYTDPETGLLLPSGVCLRERGRVTAAYALAVLLFVVTLGVGYLAWAVVTWGGGQTPAQKLLGLRCWQPDDGRLAGRSSMAIRQVTGLLLNGEFLIGPVSLLATRHMTSVGDYFARTVVLHDPDDILPGWIAPAA
jgi:hypothetical protein